MEDEDVVWRELDFVADLLADDRPYLCGERFGAADLTFAALAAAAIVPPVYGTPLPQPDELPPETAALVRAGARAPGGAVRDAAVLRPPARGGAAERYSPMASASSSTWSGSGEAGKQMTSSAPASSKADR